MEIITIVLRIIHIFSGVAWVGGAWAFVFYVEPTVHFLGPDGGKFMNYFINVRRYPVYATTAAVLTVLAGWTLWFLRYGVPSLQTGAGLTFAIGGVLGLIALGVGGAIVGPTATKLSALGQEIAKGGKPPTPEQGAQIAAYQARMSSAGLWAAILAALAVLCMAIARYI